MKKFLIAGLLGVIVSVCSAQNEPSSKPQQKRTKPAPTNMQENTVSSSRALSTWQQQTQTQSTSVQRFEARGVYEDELPSTEIPSGPPGVGWGRQ